MGRIVVLWLAAACAAAQTGAPTLAGARAFLKQAEARLLALSNQSSRASWIQSTYITDDTEALAAQANERLIAAGVEYAKQATRFDKLALPAVEARKMKLLKVSLTLAAPSNPAERTEATRLAASLESAYGKGKYCRPGGECLDLEQITRIMANNRDPVELLDVWRGWHAVGRGMRTDYRRFVELSNKGARELGFADTGAMWRTKYDLAPEAFAAELDRLWAQVRPLYESLHAYVRWKLREKYGASAVPSNGPIPAHLLGNMWAQSW
ncbi:MAG: M2 family metallopeptidase, partial [Bryobacteraceae bacterium]